VLGQFDFTSSPLNPSGATDLSRLRLPTGVALEFDASGTALRLYVADFLHRVLIYEAPFSPTQSALRLIGGEPPVPASGITLNVPEGVFLVGDTPYVIDTGNSRILRYDPFEDWLPNTPPFATAVLGQENFTDSLPNRGSPLPGTEKVSVSRPIRAVFAGALFLVDSGNHRLLVLPDATSDSLSAPPRVLGQEFADARWANLVEGGGFSIASGGGVVVDRHSATPHLYVADKLNNRVLGFRDVREVRPGDSADLVIGQSDLNRALINDPSDDRNQPNNKGLFQPTSVAVDSNEDLWVTDTGNGRVLRFRRPFQTAQNQPEADLVLGKPDFTTRVDAAPDPSRSNMSAPYGLAFTVEGHLLVSDVVHNRVLFFLKPGSGDFELGQAAEKVFGQLGFFTSGADSLANRMNSPRHIGSDTDDRLYVCDAGNNRVQVFDRVVTAGPDPLPTVILTSGGSRGSLQNPEGIFVSAATGEIWVADQRRVSLPGGVRRRRILRYPRFNVLILNPAPEVILFPEADVELPLDVALDTFGNLLVAYSTNRVAFYFPAMTPVNAASFLARITPGMIVSLFPLDQGSQRFGEETQSASGFPLPTELADIQVLVDGQPARLFFVSPGQINFLMPMNAPTSGFVELQVVRRSLEQVLAAGCAAVRVGTNPDGSGLFACTGLVRMDVASPALFAGPGFATGTGQVAALNEDFTVNSTSNPISRGKVIQLFGTGQGFVPNAPPDGEPVTGLLPTPDLPQVIVGTRFVDDSDVQFSGLAPNFSGVWQINVRIPDWVAPNDTVLLVILHKGIPSNNPQNPGQIVTTIAVKP
jgi:uncharacterized protein (TIGR03437 family)